MLNPIGREPLDPQLIKGCTLNTGTDSPLATGGSASLPQAAYAYTATHHEAATPPPTFTEEQQQAFRQNREDSLELCNDFQAFYAANAAYHLDL